VSDGVVMFKVKLSFKNIEYSLELGNTPKSKKVVDLHGML